MAWPSESTRNQAPIPANRSVFWHPRGLRLYRLPEERVRAWMLRDGFEEVRTPPPPAASAIMLNTCSSRWMHFSA